MRNLFVGLLLLVFVTPSFSSAEELNAGFVQGLWYSSEAVFDGIPTRVYVAFRNNTAHDLTGTIVFTDNGKRIGSSDVSALSGRLVEAWVDWTPTAGEHNLAVSLSNAELHIIGKGTEPVDVAGIVTEDALVIDYDTDGDGVGNTEDTDDDNDGVLDTVEKTRGSNPLAPNPKEKETIEETAKTIEVEVPETNLITEERGLEKYVGEGTADSLLGSVTKKVESAKKTLDTYREERNENRNIAESATTSKETSETVDSAGITRTKIETKNSFLGSFVSGVASLLRNIYTFILWVLSNALAHPALVELTFLIGILYMVYRTARRIGRRPT